MSTKMYMPIPIGFGSERALVVYHNRYADASGWIRTSVGFSVKTGKGDERSVVQRTLGEGLGIKPGPNSYVIFRDSTSFLEFIRPANELIQQGLHMDLRAYEAHVFTDFRQVEDDIWQSYHQVNSYLAGRGVPNMQEAIRELVVQPVLEPFRQIANPGTGSTWCPTSRPKPTQRYLRLCWMKPPPRRITWQPG